MKKYFAVFISSIYLLFTANPVFALSKLYYINNANKNTISNQSANIIKDKKYTIQKTNPYLAVSNKNPEYYSVIVFQQSGKNLYYYYESNNSKKSLNRAILKNLKEQNYSYEEVEDYTEISNFSQIAKRTITGEKKTYSFETPQQTANITQNTESKETTTLKGFVGKVGKGDKLDVYLQNAINTATARQGDTVTGVLGADWKTAENQIIAEQGSLLTGVITKSHNAQYALRNGFVRVEFNQLTTPNGKTYNISTKSIDFNVSNDGIVESTVVNVVKASLIGAAVGVVAGMISGDNAGDILRNAAVGAGVGAAGAGISTAFEKGIDAEIPASTPVEVEIQKNINVVINY